MREQTKSVRLLPDDGGELVITPNGADADQGITITLVPADAEQGAKAVALRVDGDATDALVAAIYEAQGKRYRPGRSTAPAAD